jgi:hypothetical protein
MISRNLLAWLLAALLVSVPAATQESQCGFPEAIPDGAGGWTCHPLGNLDAGVLDGGVHAAR